MTQRAVLLWAAGLAVAVVVTVHVVDFPGSVPRFETFSLLAILIPVLLLVIRAFNRREAAAV